MRVLRIVPLLAVVAVAWAAPAFAQKSTANPYRFWNVCGGNTFNTCAAVDLEVVSAGTMRLRVWNLSGLPGSDYAATVFTGIGFFNMPEITALSSTLTMSGPARPGDAPEAWRLLNEKKNDKLQIGGGVNLEMVTTSDAVDNSIASECAPASQLPSGANDLWMNPCTGPDWNSDAGWIVFRFDYTGNWDLASTEMLLKGQNGPGGASTQCITGGSSENCFTGDVVPEPVTTVLFGTGLLGVFGVHRRRRREERA